MGRWCHRYKGDNDRVWAAIMVALCFVWESYEGAKWLRLFSVFFKKVSGTKLLCAYTPIIGGYDTLWLERHGPHVQQDCRKNKKEPMWLVSGSLIKTSIRVRGIRRALEPTRGAAYRLWSLRVLSQKRLAS